MVAATSFPSSHDPSDKWPAEPTNKVELHGGRLLTHLISPSAVGTLAASELVVVHQARIHIGAYRRYWDTASLAVRGPRREFALSSGRVASRIRKDGWTNPST